MFIYDDNDDDILFLDHINDHLLQQLFQMLNILLNVKYSSNIRLHYVEK